MPVQSADNEMMQHDAPPGPPGADGVGPPSGASWGHGGPHAAPAGGGDNPQLAAMLRTQSELLSEMAAMEQGGPPPQGLHGGPPPHGFQGGPPPHFAPSPRARPAPPRLPPPGAPPPTGPDGMPPYPHHRRRPRPPLPRSGAPGGPPRPPPPHGPPPPYGPPPPAYGSPPPYGPPPGYGYGRNPVGNIARTLSNVANVAQTAAQTLPQVAQSFSDAFSAFGTGADLPVRNEVWARLADALGDVTTGFRLTGGASGEFLALVDHLAQVANGLAVAPDDAGLLAEYGDLTALLAQEPEGDSLSAFLATHAALLPVLPPLAPDASTGQQLEIVGPSIHQYRASGLDIVGPSIHQYRASGLHVNFGDIAHTLGDVASAAAQAGVQSASTGGLPAALWLFGGFGIGFAYRGWLDWYVAKAVQKSAVTTGADVAAVNPVWATLSEVLGEVSAGFRATGVSPEEEGFLRVVEHLGGVVNNLAVTPEDPALLAEYQELSEFLAAHPDSAALAHFIETHPAIVAITSSASPA